MSFIALQVKFQKHSNMNVKISKMFIVHNTLQCIVHCIVLKTLTGYKTFLTGYKTCYDDYIKILKDWFFLKVIKL